ncbi:TonB-dependent receptor domain-containing protein [Rhizorhabdus wittichii]|nr:TonB-dependent receptor [Rhizorhabdus wittichii]
MKSMVGAYRRTLVTAARGLACMAMAGALAQPALARDLRSFDIKPGRLSEAIVALGVQGGVSIGLPSASAQNLPVPGVRGRLSVDRALRRLLAGSGLHAVRIDDRSYTIAADRAKPRTAPVAAPAGPVAAPPDIIVTASKRDIRLRDFPGTIAMIDAAAAGLNGNARYGTQALVDIIPSLSSTHLGPGRNKLIIRGVADSSFTGPTQAIVGQYLGDIRLNYNAPDPDLNLYDMAGVEVLEGPQGTLYGAGSLGGIVRLVPTPPDLSQAAGSVAAGIGKVEGGGPSNDLAGMINLPISTGRIALRAVAYRSVDGGYIRDAERGLNHVNRSKAAGGRITLRARLGDWTIDAGGTLQDMQNRDGQYAERDQPRYTRRSAIAQPFDNDYRLGQIVVTRKWNDITLLSATGIVGHDVDEQFDATRARDTSPRLFHQHSQITLFSNENRLSRQNPDGTGWLVGTSFVSNSERLIRDLGAATAPARIAGVRNSVRQIAAYGELSLGLGPLIVTAGGRLAHSRLTGELLDDGKDKNEPNRSEVEVLPSIAVSWRPTPRLTTYLRYQEGFRPGGLSVAAGSGGIVSQRFLGDSIVTIEGGARFGHPVQDRFSAALSLSYSHWEHIQADLVNGAGLPITANIGNGRILGFEASLRWAPFAGFAAEGGLFLNDSELTSPSAGFEDAAHAELPNIARVGVRGALSYDRPIGGGLSLSLTGSVRYFGHSQLGVGSLLAIEQGNYADTALGLRIGTERLGASIDVTNLFDAAQNRFSLGNPFGVMDRLQVTPQIPRTVRIGVDARF